MKLDVVRVYQLDISLWVKH